MLTEHFSLREFQCKCGCGRMETDMAFMLRLEDLRRAFGKAMIVGSGYRCPAHNNRVSSTGLTGPHTIGAADILISGPDVHTLLQMAMIVGFTGIGIKQHGPMAGRFIHFDNLPVHTFLRPRVWTY